MCLTLSSISNAAAQRLHATARKRCSASFVLSRPLQSSFLSSVTRKHRASFRRLKKALVSFDCIQISCSIAMACRLCASLPWHPATVLYCNGWQMLCFITMWQVHGVLHGNGTQIVCLIAMACKCCALGLWKTNTVLHRHGMQTLCFLAME